MKESVLDFGLVLPREIMRRVTVVARGYGPMRRLDPRIVILLHHMAVGAGLRIVGQVGISTSGDESVEAESERDSDQNRDQDNGNLLHIKPLAGASRREQQGTLNAAGSGVCDF